ncbi:hypothetical protein SLINC_5954 [Streptomyces lincolnensis]|uniref:Uncharacterized protein n=1 Tax=Streptomyces lincolnensis TaxID=1915 RepID=A0A1B1MHW3_STRLN|nr:hypothetical protein [Streptomyces lincolnensis]ANS68178.1 hypothetical protein SLINC_5954 [Streptomyces lincolnensis]AXG53616.1 hypothetical protein SLCG_2461 [Streptomyces lincolnensis]QMV09826.1 hypothetical protein GJU35_32000 [Streptomyces lincolnensis]
MTVESIPVQAAPKSLVWQGDELVSAAGGGQASGHDGVAWEEAFAEIFFFDAGTTSASGRYSALYQERNLEGLLLERGEVVRELVRSDELAGDYDYPLALGALSDGREVVVHCPDEYNVLQIEDAASGERLTAGEREPQDVFHSKLSLSPDGRYLLSVGWLWHPFGVAMVYDTARALTDPGTLDGDGLVPTTTALNGEVTAGCWLDADRLVVATGTEGGGTDEAELPPGRLGVWSMSEGRWLHRSPIADAEPGVLLLPRGDQVVSFRGHPRLLDTATGRLVAEWPEVGLPVKDTCYGVDHIPSPVAALHPDGTRLAVAQAESIALITLP